MNCGIYKIMNTNGKVYIGSSIHINKRWSEHLRQLRGKYHENKYLQRSWNKYGDSFVFEVLLYCGKENLVFYEQRAIDEYKSLDGDYGYNICVVKRTDLTGSNYDEMCQRISESRKGKYKGKNSFWYDRKHTKETKRKMSENQKGENNTFYDKTHSEEIRNKISESLKGKNHPMYGKSPSEETKQKMRDNRPDVSGKNNPRAKAIIVNNKYYSTMSEAAQDLKVSNSTITRRVNSINYPGYFWG